MSNESPNDRYKRLMLFYESVVLTEEEIKAAILEAKKVKWFKERHKDYWIEQEKGSQNVVSQAEKL